MYSTQGNDKRYLSDIHDVTFVFASSLCTLIYQNLSL